MTLTLVGLPLGNIEDMSFRAIKTIADAPMVICEDTRVFNRLWQKLINLGYVKGAFEGRLRVINDFNEAKRVGYLIEEIKEGGAVLVADAGMPTISDPGYKLVREAIKAGIKVSAVPGPVAAITAAAISGLATDRIILLGFLPKKHSKRVKVWTAVKNLKDLGVTAAIYEAPQRVYKTISEMAEYLEPETELVIARELTKTFEEVKRMTLQQAVETMIEEKMEGEVVLLFRTC